MKNRILAWLLCVLMLVGMVPVSAFAATTAVAEANGVQYSDIWDAFYENRGTEDVTITLLQNVSTADQLTVSKNITLDLSGKTLTVTTSLTTDPAIKVYNYGSLTITDSIGGGKLVTNGVGVMVSSGGSDASFELQSGSIEAGSVGVYVHGKGNVATISGGSVTAETGVAVFGSTTKSNTLNVTDGKITGTETGIIGNGSSDGTAISISGGSVVGGVAGIYHPQQGTLTITAGSVTGQTGIIMKAGDLSISGTAVISATGAKDTYDPENSKGGYMSTGDALVVEQYGGAYGDVSATVTGGTFTSAYGEAVASYANTNETAPSGFISAGTFFPEAPATSLIIAGAEAVENNGAYVIAPVSGSVAVIGNSGYATLAEAIAAVKDGETVKLLKSVSGGGLKPARGAVFTLDLNGFTYTVGDPAVGSNGTETSAIQLRSNTKDYDNPGAVTIMNGTIAVAENNTQVKRLIQNYTDLTLTDVTLDATHMNGELAVAICNGSVVIDGNTSIIAPKDGYALAGSTAALDYSDVEITIETEGTIAGHVEIEGGDDDATLNIVAGTFTGKIENTGGETGTIAISGGSFAVEPADEFIAKGLDKQFAEINGKFVLITKHTCAAGTKWLTDVENHWHACTESSCPEIFDLGAHEYVDGKCSVCEYPEEGYVAPVQKPTFDYVLFALAARYAQKFDVIVSADNATVTGDTVVKYKRNTTLDIAAADGYKVVDVIANGQSLGAVETVTFKKVMGPQTLVVVTEALYTNPYADIADDNAAVQYVTENGIMTAVEEGKFAPEAEATRALIADVLYALAGTPEFDPTVTINDDTSAGIAWAASIGILTPDADGLIKPQTVITLAELNAAINVYAGTTDVAYITADDMSAAATRADVAQALYALANA